VPNSNEKVVVYIEDEPELVDLLRLIFINREEIILEHALTGRKGLELIQRLKPDLVILDLMLPDIEGWDVYREMQRNETLKDIPVIVITVRTEGLIEGVWPQVKHLAGYLVKPFTVQDLREVVCRTLALEDD
jgi:DNA-binding response OmpR family regulator